jgi:miniconductance mechanosensitive channel
LTWLGLVLAVILAAVIVNYVTKRLLWTAVKQFARRTSTTWDDYLVERKVFRRLSHMAPAVVFYYSAYVFPQFGGIIQRLSVVYMLIVGAMTLNAFLSAVNDIYNTFQISRERPIKGYLQVGKIIIGVFVGVIVVATLIKQSPWGILTGLGAMTAVLILVFKDSILGLVASIQLSSTDMVRVGDWIEMPKYGADGDVIDVSLHTVKVQNWDKTITTIPSHMLVSDSFKNWRGMSESGGRRIKRSIKIDMRSVKFCTPEMLDRFERFQLIGDYVKQRRAEIADFNVTHKVDTSELVNGRNMTNLGTFRAYVAVYLRSHPMVHENMTFLVRHLPPTENGLPLEVYVFSKDQAWANYEAIQADIFDHLLAVIPMFDLRVFQRPSGHDLQMLGSADRAERD